MLPAERFALSAADFDDPKLIALLELHTARARAETARGSAHALDLDGLRTPAITVWRLMCGSQLAGVGALRAMSRSHGEVKSMFIAESARRRGAGRALLAHIATNARARGMLRLSLETGSWEYFVPARRLYSSFGFIECAPFGDYNPDPNSVFMSLTL